jgi:hypothetical protein
MPNMTVRDRDPGTPPDDDFDRPASRGFVRHEVALLRADMQKEFANVRMEMANLRADLQKEIADLRLEIAERLSRLETRLWWRISVTVGVMIALQAIVQRV